MLANAMAIIRNIRLRQDLTDPLNHSDELAIKRITAFINDYEDHRTHAQYHNRVTEITIAKLSSKATISSMSTA